ncbi:MAG TPA: response regulator [Falsiroseomonas sp.]|jgi:PAS domain S-box-containing protein|nr:response regulator [Falsiroseomonas sp.]
MTSDSRRDTILVVDDEPEILTALGDLLEHDYAVLTAGSPAEALALLERTPEIAVIVSDQRMPGMTGDALLARAREFSSAEALLLTGYADLEAVVRAINNGGIAGYLPKPWEPAALRSMVAAARDRWLLTRALETERRLLHGLLDNSPDALSFKDREGRFVRLNAVKAEALGTTVEACLGRKEGEFLPPPDAVAALANIESEVMSAGVPSGTTEERTAEDGSTRWFEVNRIPIHGRCGTGYLVTMEREVTDARLLEARLRQADKMQALGSLAGGVAHDFNNLLTAILGGLRMAARRDMEEDRRARLLANALAAAERGAGLTQRLLSFARRQPLAAKPTDANRVIEEMEELFARSLGGMARVEKQLAPGLWPALVDREQLELALLNLCINARDAMPGGGTVTLSTRNATLAADGTLELRAGDYVVVSVRDAGIGMTPKVLRRVFEPFFTTKEVGKGTGLGLPMVYGLAQQSGGTVTIASALGKGTTVEVFLPRSDAPVFSAPEPGQALPAPARCVGILVVDDDPNVREVTSALLKEIGHRVTEAPDALHALRSLEQDRGIELLLTDFAMPQMTGLELAARAQALRPGLQVLLMTGYADVADVPRDLTVLRKPFEHLALADLVSELTRPP